MDRNATIVVTGAAGFIGSCMVGYLNERGYENLVIVDDFSEEEKKPNYSGKKFSAIVEREELFDWLPKQAPQPDFVFHLGARTDTTEFNYSIHEYLNVEYSKKIWNYCSGKNIPLVYASSAATYGGGEFGYDDDHEIVEKLQPLNPYGVSKNEFDKWALENSGQLAVGSRQSSVVSRQSSVVNRQSAPPSWAGLKFFNVYGPNEYHKARMASVVFHAFNQIKQTGKVKLFRSHKEGFKDGEQLRDFIYVRDVVKICFWFMEHFSEIIPGLYNVGTGRARTFNDLVRAIFKSLDLPPQIEFIDTPADIRDKYQYFTEANMSKLRAAGYNQDFYSLEEGVQTYVRDFLSTHNYY
jgi:ADP-L-glycero-D-manno-heptose 6-epimerase